MKQRERASIRNLTENESETEDDAVAYLISHKLPIHSPLDFNRERKDEDYSLNVKWFTRKFNLFLIPKCVLLQLIYTLFPALHPPWHVSLTNVSFPFPHSHSLSLLISYSIECVNILFHFHNLFTPARRDRWLLMQCCALCVHLNQT